jgi:hypothetical protein
LKEQTHRKSRFNQKIEEIHMKAITLVAVLAAAIAGSAPNKHAPPVEKPNGVIVIYVLIPAETQLDSMLTDGQSLLLFRPPPENEPVTEVFSL